MTITLAELTTVLDQDEPEQRRIALQQLVSLRGEGVVELFVRSLGDDDWRVRKEAVSLTPRVEPKDRLLRLLSVALQNNENIGLRNAAVEALVSLGPDAVPIALGALETFDADGRKLAVEVLAGVPDARGVTRLVSALADTDANVRIAAGEALGRAGLASEPARREASAALASCLDTPDVHLVLAALESLVRLDARIPYARILPLSRHPLLRRVAISAAAHSREEPALGVLVEATVSAPASVAREATIALAGWMRETAPGAKLSERAGDRLRTVSGVHERLREASLDGDTELRNAALLLLGAVRDERDLATLVGAIQDEATSSAAQRGLELFGAGAAPGLAALLELADASSRTTLLGLLAQLGVPVEARALRVVRDCLDDASVDVIASACAALAAFGDERDLGRLVSLAVHNDARVAEAATGAVSKLASRHPQAARALLAALDPTAEHAAAGAAIVSALAPLAIAQKDSAVLDELVAFGERALRSASARARRLAVEALAASGHPAAHEKIALALADEEREVRLTAVRALGSVGAHATLRSLIGESSDEETVSVALRALADANLPMALGVARELVRGEDAALASTAVEVLSRPPGVERAQGLVLALGHRDKDVVMLALAELAGGVVAVPPSYESAPIEAVDDAHTPSVFARVATCLSHPAWEVRRLASEILGQDRSPAARELLRARLDLELEPVVREALTEALSIRPPRFDGGG